MAATIPTNGIVLNSGLNVADGDITLASGHGINFAATADASGSSLELLDDYEEGTWSPQLKSSDGTNFTMNSGNDVGYYVRIGNKVFFHAYVVLRDVEMSRGLGDVYKRQKILRRDCGFGRALQLCWLRSPWHYIRMR